MYEVPIEFLQKIYNYLLTKPYMEVSKFVEEFKALDDKHQQKLQQPKVEEKKSE